MRNRVLELREIPAKRLKAHPGNWRTHSDPQRAAYRALLDEVGFAGVILARKTGRTYQVLDGHMRVDEADPDDVLPVVVLQVSAAEAELVLATYDPLGQAATVDQAKAAALLERVQSDSAGVRQLLKTIQVRAHLRTPTTAEPDVDDDEEIECPTCAGVGYVRRPVAPKKAKPKRRRKAKR